MAARRGSKTETPFQRLLRRALWIGGTIAVLVFLIEGGEYGTRDLMQQRSRFKAELAEIRQLEREVDSLRAEYKSASTDPARLEREARERNGMVKGDKEILYWIRRPEKEEKK